MFRYPSRYNCLWCDITSLELNDSPVSRTPVKRSLGQLKLDFKYFKEELQSDVRNTKENRNVVDSCYFGVPLDQVRIKVNAYTYLHTFAIMHTSNIREWA